MTSLGLFLQTSDSSLSEPKRISYRTTVSKLQPQKTHQEPHMLDTNCAALPGRRSMDWRMVFGCMTMKKGMFDGS